MDQCLITLRAFHTGAIESPGIVRHTLAFDVAGTRLLAADIESAVIRVARRPSASPLGSVELRARGHGVLYGAADAHAPVTEVPLTLEAMADLRQATDGFFFLETVTPASEPGEFALQSAKEDPGLVLAISRLQARPAAQQAA
jgi:hypothetical protein